MALNNIRTKGERQMELKSTLIETVIENEDLIKIAKDLERRYNIRPDVVLNKL